MKPSLILASASPQRKTLLEGLGVPFTVVPAAFDESSCPEKDPATRAELLARLKAQDVAAMRSEAFVIGCDTLVTAPDGTLLEKPKDAAEAERMLRLQSGGTSVVYSGLCVIAPGKAPLTDLSASHVTFAALSEDEIRWWVGTRLWEGRSGAFQIDGPGQLMIRHVEGDWTSIVGLPVFLMGTMLKAAGYPIV